MNAHIIGGIFLIALGTLWMVYGQLIKSKGDGAILLKYAHVIGGIVLIALGTGWMVYGQYVKGMEDGAILQGKVEQVLKSIDGIKQGETAEATAGKIQQIEQEFQTWATEFLRDRERRKVTLTKAQLDSVDEQFGVSNKVRPVFEYVIRTIESLARAYNAESDQKVQIDFPPIPPNLYSEAAENYRGKVIFPSNVVWVISFLSKKPSHREHPPFMNLDFNLQKSGLPSGSYCLISPKLMKNEFSGLSVKLNGPNLPVTDGIEGEYPVASYRDSLKMITRRLFEAQLLRD
ncbi:MAG: hypothetical protein ACYDG4_16585 [Desulfuromonadaceae bacterium]